MSTRAHIHPTVAMMACLLIVSSSGCFAKPVNLNVMHMGPPYRIDAYDHGQRIAQRKLPAMSEEEMAIAHWIEANRHGWRPSYGNTPPGRIVKGDGFTLNFTENTCVLTIPPDSKAKGSGKGKTEPIVLQRRLTPGDLELAQVLNGGM